MSAEISNASGQILRQALATLDATDVVAFVDSLNLNASGRVDVLIVASLTSLKKGRNVQHFAATAPLSAVMFLVDSATSDVLARTIDLLGESADDPTYDELQGAVGAQLDEGADPRRLAAMLAMAAANQVPATEHCLRLLSETAQLALAEVDVPTATSLFVGRVVDDEIREQRRQRREQQKSKKVSKGPAGPRRITMTKESKAKSTPSVTKDTKPTAPAASPSLSREEPLETVRRRPLLTPAESALFDVEHPLNGWLVECDVPFSAPDPSAPTQSSKVRPVVVLAGAPDALLVRGVYSKPAPSRRLLTGWNRLGLVHPSYVEDERLALEIDESTTGPVRRVAQLTDAEWNALF